MASVCGWVGTPTTRGVKCIGDSLLVYYLMLWDAYGLVNKIFFWLHHNDPNVIPAAMNIFLTSLSTN